MENNEIINFCVEKGLLLDNELLTSFIELEDISSIKIIIEKIKSYTNKKFLTKDLFFKNKDKLNSFIVSLPKNDQEKLEKIRVKLGLTIEISKEEPLEEVQVVSRSVKVNEMPPCLNKKLEVKDFVNYFRGRYDEMKNYLQENSELENLVSINKISNNKQNFSVIGLISDKQMTKNKNIILEIEDLSGKMKVLINQKNEELYKKAEDITLDSVLGFKGNGNKEIIFVSEIFFPDIFVSEKKKSPIEEYCVFIGDLHYGSKLFLKNSFEKFIKYLNGEIPDTPEVEKLKYLFLVGDVVTGVGNYPDQEKDLVISDLEEQFSGLATLLKKIRKDITIVISPGNHDGVRIMEPQPLLDEKYAWQLYEMENVVLTGNPAEVNIGSTNGFTGFNVLTYHGFSFTYYANNIPKLMIEKTMNSPEKIMKYLLMNRHLAPTHASVQYFPSPKDNLIIRTLPDIFVSGHTHKSAITSYNNILVISVSSWEGITPYQEKFGNKPDHCKVPLFNLKTRGVKILDFLDESEREMCGGED